MTVREDRALELLDIMLANSNVTNLDMMGQMGLTRRQVDDAIHDLRMILGDTDSYNLTCDPDPDNWQGPWLYNLVATPEGIQQWTDNRLLDAETRIRTIEAMLDSIITGMDGPTKRSRKGLKAREMKSTLHFLVERLDQLNSAP